MAETGDTITTTVSTPQPEADATSEVASKEAEPEKKPGGILFSVWPPPQECRDGVVNSMIKILSTDSFLTSKYGTLKPEEASAVVKSFEEEAYGIASSVVSSVSDGMKNLEAYIKEIGERVNKCAEDRLKANGTKSTNKCGGR